MKQRTYTRCTEGTENAIKDYLPSSKEDGSQTLIVALLVNSEFECGCDDYTFECSASQIRVSRDRALELMLRGIQVGKICRKDPKLAADVRVVGEG